MIDNSFSELRELYEERKNARLRMIQSNLSSERSRVNYREDMDRAIEDAINEGPDAYWKIINPLQKLKLSGAMNYVQEDNPNLHIIYWPDYRVAGTATDIYNIFRLLNIRRINIGSLYNLSEEVDLSEEAIYQNSLDPLNKQHRRFIENKTQDSHFKESYQNLLIQLYNL